MRLICLLPLGALALACGSPTPTEPARPAPGASARPSAPPLLADVTLPPVGEGIDADGEDDGVPAPVGPGVEALATAPALVFARVPAPPERAHPRVCDIRGFAGAVFVSHLARAIALDGALIHRYDAAARSWSLALDWDRGGEPGKTHEVGGQGITRLRVIDNKLWATDSDAPLFGGFGISGASFEDYLFLSDERGVFPPLGADDTPPANTRLLPLAFHAFDVIAYRGALVATGGTIGKPGSRRARGGPVYPGGFFVGVPSAPMFLPRWTVGKKRDGVVRTTYAHRFGGRLYVGFQNNGRRLRADLAVLTGSPLAEETPAPVMVRVTPDGGWLTRRWASGGGVLWWIAERRKKHVLFRSTDGLRFSPIDLGASAGKPSDVAVVATASGAHVVFVLTTTGLYRGGAGGFVRVADAPPGDPFGVFDELCSAPLEIAGDALWAGSLTDGRLWRVALPDAT